MWYSWNSLFFLCVCVWPIRLIIYVSESNANFFSSPLKYRIQGFFLFYCLNALVGLLFYSFIITSVIRPQHIKWNDSFNFLVLFRLAIRTLWWIKLSSLANISISIIGKFIHFYYTFYNYLTESSSIIQENFY